MTERPEIIHASKKRLLVAWYIDFLFFMTAWAVVAFLMPSKVIVPFWMQLLIFVPVRFLVAKLIGSTGYQFLSISQTDQRVDQALAEKETWLSMFLGVLLVLEGTKLLVRWTEVFVSQPVLGFFPAYSVQIGLQVLLGALSVVAGYWFLKLDIKGLILGIGLTIFNLVSITLSWSLWDPVVKEKLITRREAQGLEVNAGEIEVMQLIMPEAVMLILSLMLIAMVLMCRRFTSRIPGE